VRRTIRAAKKGAPVAIVGSRLGTPDDARESDLDRDPQRGA
jgi:hypothetical protein